MIDDEELWEEADELPPEESTVEEMRQAGADLLASHPVQHYFYFPMVSQVQGTAEELRSQGFQVQYDRDFEDQEWELVAMREMVVSVESLREIRAAMERLARGRGGIYDGWNVPVEDREQGVPVMDEDDAADYYEAGGDEDD